MPNAISDGVLAVATILIVDDHPALRVVLKLHLSQILGVAHVLEADNGQAAVEIVRQYAPDVVILDLDIPRINGLDVIPRLRAIQPNVRILVISGQDQSTFARARGRPAPMALSARPGSCPRSCAASNPCWRAIRSCRT